MSRFAFLDAWTRLGSEVLDRMPELSSETRRIWRWSRTPQRIASDMHEAWLDAAGGVSKNRYLTVLEENLELRRRLEAVERRRSERGPGAASDDPASEAMNGAFQQIRDAQEQWLSMWLPASPGSASKGSAQSSTHKSHRDEHYGGGSKK